MAIFYDETAKTFTLETQKTTYQMKIDPFGFLLHTYYGRKAEGDASWVLTYADRGFSGNPYEAGSDRTYSMDTLPQEYPVNGTGDFRSPALIVRDCEGTFGCDLRYVSHSIEEGKYALAGLPAAYADTEKAQTLRIFLRDDRLELEAELLYGVIPSCDVITRAAVITNCGEAEVTVEKAQSAVLDLLHGEFDLVTFYGRHAMERNTQRQRLGHGEFNIGSRRGASSHQYNPLMNLAEPHTTETAGDAYAMEFVYSGGFRGEAGVDQLGQTRLQMGVMDEGFSYPLGQGESFTAPEVLLSFSAEGLGRLSRNLHDCIREHIVRGRFKTGVRPILLNSWEASYFDFTGESLLKLAQQAKELDMDMLVMDDGWFGGRCDDNRALGDWTVNEEKLGCTLGELVRKVQDLGLKFGIWFEPEMVNEDSELYRAHPDWAMVIDGKKPVRSRNQLLLDFSRKEVVDGIFAQTCAVLDQADISYLKWDFNRSIADVYSHANTSQGKVLYDYVLGLYDFLERLTARYPDMMIEGCCGGGGRFDAGMLYYTPQIWCSDNTDAIDRLRIQYGTSFGYPCSAVGSHVSVCPNEQNGRITPLETRGHVAMGGTFGYEMDPAKLPAEEKEAIRTQVARFRQLAPLVMQGDYYRLSDPFADEVCAWEILAKDGSELLLTAVMLEVHGNMTPHYVRLQGLEDTAVYEDEAGHRYPGAVLKQVGLPLPMEMGAYHSYQYLLKKV